MDKDIRYETLVSFVVCQILMCTEHDKVTI